MECRNCYGAVAKMIEPKDAEITRLTQQLYATKEYAERLREALGHTSVWIEGLPVPTAGATARLKQIDSALALPRPWGKA